jgi:hypothetical protein
MDSAGDDESQSGELTLTQVLVSGPLAFPTGVVACFAPSGLIRFSEWPNFKFGRLKSCPRLHFYVSSRTYCRRRMV